MAVAFPSGVPTAIALDYVAQPQNGRVEFAPDLGPAIKRRGTTLDVEQAVLRFEPFTRSEYAIFRAWYVTTAKQGTEDFTFPDPISGVSSVWAFTDSYTVQGITDDLLQVSIPVLRLRAA